MKPAVLAIFAIFLIPFFLVGLGLVGCTALAAKSDYDLRRFEPTTCTVKKLAIHGFRAKHAVANTYSGSVELTATIEGEAYDDTTSLDGTWDDKETARKVLAEQYAAGKTVPCFYDPESRSTLVLSNKPTGAWAFFAIFAVCWNGSLLAIAFFIGRNLLRAARVPRGEPGGSPVRGY